VPGSDSQETISATRANRSVWRVAAISLLGLVAFALVTEAGLRVILGVGDPILITPDSACAYITKPDQKVYRFFVHTYINHYGMRSDDVPPTRPAGVVRLLFVGDSLTYGTTHVDQSQLFTQIVGRGLPAIVHHPVEVLNASASAFFSRTSSCWY
jgi:hypothetical protein